MVLKKLVLLPVIALAAAAFAIPASASAAMFYDNGAPIGEAGIEQTYAGSIKFENANGGVACSGVTWGIRFNSESANSQGITLAECGTFGALKMSFGCELMEDPTASSGYPWPITGPESLKVGGFLMHWPLGPSCGLFAGGTGSFNFASNEFKFITVGTEGTSTDNLTLSGEIEWAYGPLSVTGTLTNESSTGRITLE